MAAISFLGVNGNLLRQSLRLGLSVLITCAIAQH
ncbi:MAG: FUSC family protein, partial [Synechococcaceae bacterium WB9_4xC_028]|nr:FUSC family protein [Synechococcaceae bacterium WB9_4xC_028]